MVSLLLTSEAFRQRIIQFAPHPWDHRISKCSLTLILVLSAAKLVGCQSIDYNRVAQSSIVLVGSSDSTERSYGWAALTASLRGASSSRELPQDLLDKIEASAKASGTYEAFQTLETLYSLHPSRRKAALLGAAANASPTGRSLPAFAAAIIASTRAPSNPSNSSWLDRTHAFTRSRGTDQGKSTPLELLSEILTGVPTKTREEVVLQLAHFPSDQQSAWPLAAIVLADAGDLFGVRLPVLAESLARCAITPQAEDFNRGIANACADAYKALAQKDHTSLQQSGLMSDSWTQLLNLLKPVQALAAAPTTLPTDRVVKIEVLPSVLTFGAEQTTSDGTRLANADGHGDAFGIRRDAVCLSGGTAGRSHTSACFEPYYSQSSDSTLPGLAIHAFGIQHYAWVSQGGSASLHYRVQFGYQPSPDSNWVGLRWRGWKKTPISSGYKCLEGCKQAAPDAVEPSEQWGFYSVTPKQLLAFQIDLDATVDPRGPNSFVLPYIECFELYELNEAALPAFTTFNPLEITKQVDSNPVGSYLASLQLALSAKGWLTPQDVDAARAAALAESRLKLMSDLSAIADSEIAAIASPGLQNEASGEYAHSRWKQRKALLNSAIPVITARVSEMYNPSVSSQLQLQGQYLPRVLVARNQLTKALQSLDAITSAEGDRLLTNASTTTKRTPFNAQKLGHDELTAALFGAQEAVASFQRDLVASVELGCAVQAQMGSPTLAVCATQKSQ